ncbi:MAG: DUF349 domain-containing protein [Gammaproteobacteria bacterium]|nr:DUF349 domain-containing protein [Gammaproteobacteria bacterium]
MLRKLFSRKPRLDADDPAVRTAALADLGDGDQATFARVFRGDADRDVRLKALERLTRPDVVFEGLGDEQVAAEALGRLLSLIDDDTPETIRHHPAVQRAALASAETADAALAIAPSIADPAVFAAALAENPRAQVRQAVAEATWDPATLSEMEKTTRRRDKSVHRVARDRLALLRTASHRRDEEDTQTETILATAVALEGDDPHYEARRDAIERDWTNHLDAMGETDRELERFSVVARDLNAIRRRFPARRQPAQAHHPEVEVDFGALLTRAESLLADVADSLQGGAGDKVSVEDAKQSVDDIAAEWNAGADAKPPGEELSARFREVMASVAARTRDRERMQDLLPKAEEILARDIPDPEHPRFESFEAAMRELRRQRDDVDRLLGRFAWPDDVPELEEIAALKQRQRDLAAAAEQSETHADAMLDQVTDRIAELRQSIEDGAVHDAVEQDRQLREFLKGLPRAKAQPFGSDLAELGARVRELREWRTYAQAPQRESLCQQIEELAANPLEPHDQMRTVKSLRDQWNQLGPADTRRDRDLKRRFDRAAEQAFEPCRTYFKEQAERRAFNLEQRQAIVAALEGFLENNDWGNADWRGVERILRQARNEWREYHPVDRKAGRQLTNRFEELASAIHALLKQEWDRNIEKKEAIVADAIAIRESGDRVTDQAESMKGLQRRWKAVGPLPRRADQRLWKQFREQCDQVFEARAVVLDRHSQRRQVVTDADALITELERRLEIDPSLDRNMVADYERRLHALGMLPKDVERRADEVLRDADRIVVARQAEDSSDK